MLVKSLTKGRVVISDFIFRLSNIGFSVRLVYRASVRACVQFIV